MKFLKFVKKATILAFLMLTVNAFVFSAGFVARPSVYNYLPDRVQNLISPEKSHVHEMKLDTYNSRLLLGVFKDHSIRQLDPNDMKMLLSKDLLWVIDVKYNKAGPSLPAGKLNWYETSISDNKEKKMESETQMTAAGPMTVLNFVLPVDDYALVAKVTLVGAENFKVSAMKNEVPEEQPKEPALPKKAEPKKKDDSEEQDEF